MILFVCRLMCFCLAAFCLTVFSSGAKAENRDYWVVGSYASKENAYSAMEEIGNRIGITPQARLTEGGLYRLVLRVSQITAEELNAANISAWTITLSTDEETTNKQTQDSGFLVLEEPSAHKEPSALKKEPSAHRAKEPSAAPAAHKMRKPSAYKEPSAAPAAYKGKEPSIAQQAPSSRPAKSELPPLHPSQTLTSYCAEHSADFCAGIDRIKLRATSLEARRAALLAYCDAEAREAELQQICQRLNR